MGLMGVCQVLVEGGQLELGIAVIVGPGERRHGDHGRPYLDVTDQGSSASAGNAAEVVGVTEGWTRASYQRGALSRR